MPPQSGDIDISGWCFVFNSAKPERQRAPSPTPRRATRDGANGAGPGVRSTAGPGRCFWVPSLHTS